MVNKIAPAAVVEQLTTCSSTKSQAQSGVSISFAGLIIRGYCFSLLCVQIIKENKEFLYSDDFHVWKRNTFENIEVLVF